MGTPRGPHTLGVSILAPLFLFLAIVVPDPLSAHGRALRKHGENGSKLALAPDPFDFADRRQDAPSQRLESSSGFVELFKKLFSGGGGEEAEEPPTTSEQRRSSWREEERVTEYAFCTDVGFRGLHPEEGGEETACWSRCGRVCEGSLFLAEDALSEWRLISVATRTKPCKTLAKKSAVQILCKAVKKPTHFDISTAVKQEMTFDVEAQQQEQLQQLQQQQLLMQQPAAMPTAAAAGEMVPGYLPQASPGELAAPETFTAAAYGRRKSGFPQWTLYLAIVGIALICAMALCCCLYRKRL